MTRVQKMERKTWKRPGMEEHKSSDVKKNHGKKVE